LILIGNKSDLETERIITKVRAIEFAEQHNVNYIETSALHNINVGEAIESLLDSVMDHLEVNLSKPNQNPVKLLNDQIARDLMETNRTKPVPKKSYCCSY